MKNRTTIAVLSLFIGMILFGIFIRVPNKTYRCTVTKETLGSPVTSKNRTEVFTTFDIYSNDPEYISSIENKFTWKDEGKGTETIYYKTKCE